MNEAVTIDGGFAEVTAGAWLMGRGQPVAFFGDAVSHRLKGFVIRDRSELSLVKTEGKAICGAKERAFLTHIPCAAPISAISAKILVAPQSARAGAELVKVLPMSLARAMCVTKFESGWVVMATSSRTTRIKVAEGETLSVRPEAVVAWTGARPTGFVKKLGIMDLLLPRGPRNMLLHFHGECIVWIEGSAIRNEGLGMRNRGRGGYGV